MLARRTLRGPSLRATHIFLVAGAAALLIPARSEAKVHWFKKKSAKYKIQVCLNSGMKLKTSRRGKWAALGAKERGVKVLVMAYTGAISWKMMEKVAVRVSKIPGNYWRATRKSRHWHGFGKNATYIAKGADQVAIAFLAKHGRYIDRNYVVLIRTSKKNFLRKKKVFNAWGNCLRALP